MEENNIVAIDLGTSKIALTVAKVYGDDIQIVYYKETPSAGMRYSSVFNSTHVSGPLRQIIQDAEESLDIKINQAFVGMPKYHVRQESNSGIIKDRGEDTDITEEDIMDLKRYAEDSYPLEDPVKDAIYGAVAQSFSDGENFQIIESDIIGMTSDVLEGHFKIFIGKQKGLKDIDMAMTKSGISAKKKFFTADTTAKAVLTAEEMENGVALIDFGGGCTSVTIYHGSIMRHYASIPFGGHNITDDIKTEAQISERLAENIKLAFGACMPDKLQNLSEKVIHIASNNSEPDKKLPVKYLSEIITARVEEIIMAMLYEINESGFADMLRSGIVVTGGCAQTANLGNFINELSGYKVRTGYPHGKVSTAGCDGINETSAATSIGLILAAKEEESVNCIVAGEYRKTVVIETEDEEVEEVIEVKEPERQKEEEQSQRGTLFDLDKEGVEKVEPPKKKKEKKKSDRENIIKVIWGKAIQKAREAMEEGEKLIDEFSNEDINTNRSHDR